MEWWCIVILPQKKLVRIILENWNLVYKYTHTCGFIKYTFKYQNHLNFADVSIFCKKISLVPLLKALVWQLCLRFFSFVKKVAINQNVRTIDHESRIWLPSCYKWNTNRKNDKDIMMCQHDRIIPFFSMSSCFYCQV